jgi:hypothetical protein
MGYKKKKKKIDNGACSSKRLHELGAMLDCITARFRSVSRTSYESRKAYSPSERTSFQELCEGLQKCFQWYKLF